MTSTLQISSPSETLASIVFITTCGILSVCGCSLKHQPSKKYNSGLFSLNDPAGDYARDRKANNIRYIAVYLDRLAIPGLSPSEEAVAFSLNYRILTNTSDSPQTAYEDEYLRVALDYANKYNRLAMDEQKNGEKEK